MTVMSQRLKVMEMVTQMHEKNLVLMNILRDIVENETSSHVGADATDGDIARQLADKALRRTEILGEIRHVLLREDMAHAPARRTKKVAAPGYECTRNR